MSDINTSSGDPRHLLVEALSRHSKILVIALLLSFAPGMQAAAYGNDTIARFSQAFTEELHAKKLDPAVIWKRTGPLQCTVLVLLDGHKTQSALNHQTLATTLWATELGIANLPGLVVPYVHADGQAGFVIRKDRPEWHTDLERCGRWLGEVFGQQAPT